ncbi:MAG TPA: M67 family metallopeptidase [Thermoplasmata archaeon]|nr:M67 family metallopeptidase [Thermoplasmata archaeon]
MSLVLAADHVRAIEAHARDMYPEECCGFLLGAFGQAKRVIEVRRATNVASSDRERRYEIEGRELLAMNRLTEEDGKLLIGFYHSHPDHPARPSSFDESRGTWPGYSYVILSIVDGNPNDLRSWTLEKEGGPFRAETLSITA